MIRRLATAALNDIARLIGEGIVAVLFWPLDHADRRRCRFAEIADDGGEL